MSPNLVFQQVISHHKSRVSPSMSISILEASMADSQPMGNGCQWYIYTFFHTLKWICTTNIVSRQFTPLQQQNKWAWTASHPTQRPVQLPSTVPTLPTSSVWGVWGFSGSFGFPSSVGSFSSWMAKDLIWSRCRVNKRKVGGATGPQVEKQSMLSQCLMMVVKVVLVKILFYSFSAKIASQSLFLECKFKSLSGRIYQMSYSVFPANLWVQIWCSNKWFHTTKADYHQACPYPLLKPPWLIRSQSSMVITFFHTLKWICTTNILSREYPDMQQHNKWAWTASHPTQPFQPYLFSLRNIIWLDGGLDLASVPASKSRFAG